MMPPTTKDTQRQKFEDAAREVGADQSEEEFKARLRKIAKAKVTSEPPEPPRDSGQADEDKSPEG